MNNPICYHCKSQPPNRHSVFCDACLKSTGLSRHPLRFREDRPALPLGSRLLLLASLATTIWLIVKAAEVISTP